MTGKCSELLAHIIRLLAVGGLVRLLVMEIFVGDNTEMENPISIVKIK